MVTRTTAHEFQQIFLQQWLNGARIILMAKRKDGITDFTKSLVLLARLLNPKDYETVSNTMFALHNGVNFGYDDTFDPQMIKDAQDIYKLHHTKKKDKAEIIKLKLIKGGKDETVKV